MSKRNASNIPDFTRWNDFASWNDLHGAIYEETEVDGKLIGVLFSERDKIIGVWYNQAGFGTISRSFSILFPNVADDVCAYCEKDSFWPYGV